MAVDKSTYNRKIKVSQSTIDDIKKLGMSKALRLAKENAAGPQKGLVAEYQEATRRLYGDKRFAAATGASVKKPSTSYSPAPMKASTKYSPVPMGTGPKKASTSYSPAPMKTPAKKPTFGGFSLAADKITGKNKSTSAPKKDNTKSNLLKGVAGTVAAVGILALGKGKGAGVAAKLAPGLMKNKVAQAALTGEIKKAAPKAVKKAAVKPKTVSQSSYDTMVAAKRGQTAASAGKSVTPEQFSAMSSAAKAAKKAPAKKTVKPRSTNTPAKPMPKTAKGQANYGKFGTRDEYLFEKNAPMPKKTGLTAGRRFDANAPKAKAPKKTK
jgi:hypothetical protein